jgi:hypothetical protein
VTVLKTLSTDIDDIISYTWVKWQKSPIVFQKKTKFTKYEFSNKRFRVGVEKKRIDWETVNTFFFYPLNEILVLNE